MSHSENVVTERITAVSAPGSKIWEHATETVLLLEVCALAAVAVLPSMGTPLWSLPVVLAFGGLVTGFVIWCMTGSARFSWLAVFMGCYTAGWALWASGGWMRPAVLVAWAAGTIAFIPLTALAAAHARDNAQEAVANAVHDPLAEKREEMLKFEHMFRTLGFTEEVNGEEQSSVRVMDLSHELAGRVVRLQLPRSGKVTLRDLEQVAHRIEVILRMRPGTAEFGHDGHAGDVTLRLRERDFLRSTIPFRGEHRATTINKPFAVGVQEDGSVASITLRRLHARIIGVTDAGKSNLINVILAQLCGMVDTVVWVIDMKGGMVAKPWLRPYADGRTNTPAIDWVATTREEAALMMQCLVKGIDARANAAGGSQIIPSASRPQIILVCDEMADLWGVGKGTRKQVGQDASTNNEFIGWGEQVTQKGRALAVASLWATQRGTNTMAGSGDMKANTKLEIILGTKSQAEAMYANADNKVAQKRAAALVDTPGAGTITMAAKASLATKFFFLDHLPKPGGEDGETLCDDGCVPQCPIYRIAMDTATVRPQLDRLTALAMGDEYAERWTRAAGMLKRPAGPQGGLALAPAVDTTDFDSIMRKGFGKDPESRQSPQQREVLDYLTHRGAHGATPNNVLGHMTGKFGSEAPARETISRWLRKFEGEGLVHNASFGRWKIGPDPKKADAA